MQYKRVGRTGLKISEITLGTMIFGNQVNEADAIKIMDLARRLVQLSGRQVREAIQPDGDIEFAFVGLRPGEKLFEELLIGANPTPTAHPRIMMAHEHFMPWPELQEQLHLLEQAASQDDEESIRLVLKTCVDGFQSPVAHPEPEALAD